MANAETSVATTADAASLPGDGGRYGDYRLRFARTAADVEAARALRSEVFDRERGRRAAAMVATRADAAEFDDRCHHLLVENGAGAVVGTYRVQTAALAAEGTGYWTRRLYDMDAMPLCVLDKGVEIAQGCTHRDHRRHGVHALLWYGLTRYLAHYGLRYLFGSCPTETREPATATRLYRYLERAGAVHSAIDVPVRPHSRCEPVEMETVENAVPRLPAMLTATVRRGALVCSRPARRLDTDTIEFLLLIDTARLGADVQLFVERCSNTGN